MEVMQAIKERRSIRKYRNQPVTDEMVQAVLEAARWAPSWANTQCWRLIVVRKPELKARLAETLVGIRPGVPNRGASAVKDAPVLIVACAVPGTSGCYTNSEGKMAPATDKGDWWYMFDVGLAMQNLSLAAHALGLGTIHLGLFDAAAAARLLGIPAGTVVVEMMPLGWPDEKPNPRPRKELGDFVHYETYSVPEQGNRGSGQ